MADVSHELGSLRFVVDSPLSSKVAMFNNQANQHKQSQLLNPFSNSDGRVSPKPQFSKDEYGKPLAGSLTEMRGQKANIHVMKEMLELCQIIDSEGYTVKDEPTMRVIPFGELFNIYNYISDKVVGILLRARKHKLVEFEGEMLFQRRDDDVPIFLLKPIQEIRQSLEAKMEEMKRATSPAPQATSVLLDRSAHMQKLKQDQEASLGVPKMRKSKSRSPSPSPATSAAGSRVPTPTPTDFDAAKAEVELKSETEPKPAVAVAETAVPQPPNPEITVDEPPTSLEEATASGQTMAAVTADIPDPAPAATVVADNKTDINNNSDDQVSDAPVSAVIEASAEHVRRPSVEDGASTETTASSVAVEATAGAVSEVPPSAEASAGNAAV